MTVIATVRVIGPAGIERSFRDLEFVALPSPNDRVRYGMAGPDEVAEYRVLYIEHIPKTPGTDRRVGDAIATVIVESI